MYIAGLRDSFIFHYLEAIVLFSVYYFFLKSLKVRVSDPDHIATGSGSISIMSLMKTVVVYHRCKWASVVEDLC